MTSKACCLSFAIALAACTTTRETQRQVNLQEQTQSAEHLAQHSDAASTITTVAGPVSMSEDDELVIPPGSTIETPAGRVQLPVGGAPAHIYRRAKALEGPVRTEADQKTTVQTTDYATKTATVAKQVQEKSKTVTQAGPGWRLWLGLFLALAIVLGVAGFVLKSHLPSIPWPWSRS